MKIKPNKIIPGLQKVEGGYFFPDGAFEALSQEDLDPENGSGAAIVREILENTADSYEELSSADRPQGIVVQRSREATRNDGTLMQTFSCEFYRLIKKGRIFLKD